MNTLHERIEDIADYLTKYQEYEDGMAYLIPYAIEVADVFREVDVSPVTYYGWLLSTDYGGDDYLFGMSAHYREYQMVLQVMGENVPQSKSVKVGVTYSGRLSCSPVTSG